MVKEDTTCRIRKSTTRNGNGLEFDHVIHFSDFAPKKVGLFTRILYPLTF